MFMILSLLLGMNFTKNDYHILKKSKMLQITFVTYFDLCSL